MQGFCFLVKSGLVLIYVLKVARKRSSSILLRKNMFNSLLALNMSNSVPSQVLKDFSVENLETTRNFLLRSICLALLIIGVVFLHYT